MVTPRHRNLCFESSPARCQRCFPDLGRSEFFLRKRYVERFFHLVDAFVAPSHFLAERYIAWGVPQTKMTVLENVMPAVRDGRAVSPPEGTLRIGFFGQVSGLKGINVLFDAAEALAEQGIIGVTLEIFGDYRNQPPDFQTEFLERLAKAGRNVSFHGPYDRSRVDRLMQSVHAVLVPSIWWENSPVVIRKRCVTAARSSAQTSVAWPRRCAMESTASTSPSAAGWRLPACCAASPRTVRYSPNSPSVCPATR